MKEYDNMEEDLDRMLYIPRRATTPLSQSL